MANINVTVQGGQGIRVDVGENTAAAAASATQALGFRDEAEGFRDEAEGFRDEAEGFADDADAAASRAESITQANVVDFTAAADGNVMLGANYTSPSTRYSSAIDGSGWLDLTAIQAAGMIVGWRGKGSPKIGRTFTTVSVCGTAGFNTTIGPAIGFDTSRSTGADAQGAASSRYITWRSNGVVQVQDGQGSNVTATEGYTITTVSGTVPTFVAGDVLTMALLIEDDAGTKRGRLTLQRGTAIAVVRISPLPEGFPVAGFNLTGSATVGNRQTGELRSFGWADATVLNQNVVQTINQLIALDGGIPAVTDWRSPVRYARGGENAMLSRVPPTPFAAFPVKPVVVHGPGHADYDRTAVEAMLAAFPAILTSSIAYLSPNGNDGTGALNNPALPFATLNHALRSTTAQIIVLEPGAYDPFDFRATHANGGLAKLIVARRPGTARIRVAGTDISTLTWTDLGDGAWQCTYPAGPGGSLHVHRMLNRLALDRDGFPSRAARRTSVATVKAEARAYWNDTTNRQITFKWDGINIEANKAAFQALWMDAAGNARTFQMGTTIGFQGVILDGVQVALFNNGSAGSTCYAHNCLNIFSPDHGVNDLGVGGHFIATRWRQHASFADGVNLNNSATTRDALICLADWFITEAGDAAGQVVGATQNRQAVSSHSGLCGLFGGVAERSFGQEIADTSNTPGSSASWLVAVLARDDTGRVTGKAGIGLYGNASGPDRAGWIDTCAAPGIADGLVLADGATAKIYDSADLLPATVLGGSGQPVAYTPGAP